MRRSRHRSFSRIIALAHRAINKHQCRHRHRHRAHQHNIASLAHVYNSLYHHRISSSRSRSCALAYQTLHRSHHHQHTGALASRVNNIAAYRNAVSSRNQHRQLASHRIIGIALYQAGYKSSATNHGNNVCSRKGNAHQQRIINKQPNNKPSRRRSAASVICIINGSSNAHINVWRSTHHHQQRGALAVFAPVFISSPSRCVIKRNALAHRRRCYRQLIKRHVIA